jgi:hypothetical protein
MTDQQKEREARILDALREAPGTAAEIAAVLHMTTRVVSPFLRKWTAEGRVIVTGRVWHGKHLNELYAIAESAQAAGA